MDAPGDMLDGGPLNAAIANEIVKLVAEYTGRGATKSRAFVHDDVVVCLLEEGMTKSERSLLAAGKDDTVRLLRDMLQRTMEDELVAVVERLTGRKVLSFLSGTSTAADHAVELFVLAPSE